MITSGTTSLASTKKPCPNTDSNYPNDAHHSRCICMGTGEVRIQATTIEVMARCQHPDCEVEGDEVVHCYIPDDTDQPAEAFCAEHCFEHGYCWGCGFLWAGIEYFDFASDGLCEFCHDEFHVDEDWAADDYELYGASDPAYWRSQPVKLIP